MSQIAHVVISADNKKMLERFVIEEIKEVVTDEPILENNNDKDKHEYPHILRLNVVSTKNKLIIRRVEQICLKKPKLQLKLDILTGDGGGYFYEAYMAENGKLKMIKNEFEELR